jgi:hypothetical protein
MSRKVADKAVIPHSSFKTYPRGAPRHVTISLCSKGP